MLALDNISVELEGTPALDDVSFAIDAGEVLAILGPSGSGKTTLLRTIAGLQRPSAGTVKLHGRTLNNDEVHTRSFSMMFQDHVLFPHLDVAENVEFGLRMQDVTRRDRAARVDHLLQTFKLDGFQRRRVQTLSGGEAQRVALARAIAPRPQLLLLDEPFGSLDQDLRAELLQEVQQIFLRDNSTVLFVTHDREEALTIGDRVAVMNSGRLARIADTEEIWRNPGSEMVARFLGFSTFLQTHVDKGVAVINVGSHEIPAPELDISNDDEVSFAAPSDAFRVSDKGKHEARVTSRAVRAAHVVVGLDVDGQIISGISSLPGPRLGDEVRFDIDTETLVRLPTDSSASEGPEEN